LDGFAAAEGQSCLKDLNQFLRHGDPIYTPGIAEWQ